jgi:hypothetical protein
MTLATPPPKNVCKISNSSVSSCRVRPRTEFSLGAGASTPRFGILYDLVSKPRTIWRMPG